MTQSNPDAIGRYQILRSIGSGGMGTLFLARDPKIGNRHVAIKLLREGFDSPELRERFTREADAAGGLHHVNIVTIFDVGEFEGQPFIAMEYIEGETLTDLINRRAALSLGRKLQLMEELCTGLRYAHRAGIVHRDIKPANIMIDQDGVLKILDFGIARLGSSGMTRAGMVIGTLNYMAPEQMAGEQVDSRADIFSAGAVFYELLTYRRAFAGELPGIVHKIMTATREPLATLMPDLDPGVVAIVDKCLERDAANRYPDMAAARRDLSLLRQRIVAGEQRSLDAHMEEARAALERADYQAALQACADVLALDSEYGPALEVQQRARQSSDEQHVREWLAQARAELERGAMTAASLLVDRALAITVTWSDSSEALAVREAIGEARRRTAEAQARAEAEAEAKNAAQALLEAQTLEVKSVTADKTIRVEAAAPQVKAVPAEPMAPIAKTLRLDAPAAPSGVHAAEPAPQARRRVPAFAIAGAAVLVLAVAAGFLLNGRQPPAPAPLPSTAVVFQLAPWARIDGITRKADGRPVDVSAVVTPAVVPLPPGDYHVRASNPNFPPLEFDLTVKSGESQTVRQEMPGFDPQKEIGAIVGQ